MSGVDQRIVEMNFKGDSFLNGVKNSITALLGLKKGLSDLKGSESQINSLNDAGKRFSLSGMANGIQGLTSKFSSLSVIGVAALATITNKAVNAGLTLVKSLTLDPITAGFQKYELGINATQRIIANTGASLKTVTGALNDLNTYSNQTIYNFEQMTQAIGQFTAAGIPLKASVADIKGMSNAAALTGASMSSLQSAFYQMSQAMAGGVIKLQDWNSLQNAGVADGKEFQQAFEETAASMGHNVDALVAKQGGFRNSLQKGWLTADVFSKTMSVMAGNLNTATGQTTAYTVAQLKAMGYTEAQAVSLHKLSAAALDTATKTRSFSQLLDNLKDDASTAWAHVFQAIIGNLPQATSEFTKLSNVAQNVFLGPVNDLAKFIDEWNKLGGRAALIDAVVSSFRDLSKILGTVKAAFSEVFPSSGSGPANGFVSLTKSLDSFVQKLTPTKATLNDIKTIFVGLFSAVKIVIDVFAALFGAFAKVGGAASGSSGGILHLLANFTSLITKFREFIESSDILQKIFHVLATVIELPVKVIGDLIGKLSGFGGAASGATSAVGNFISKVGAEFSKLSDAIVNGIKSGDLSKIGTLLDQLLLAGVLVKIRSFITGLGKASADSGGGGLFDTIKESFDGLTNTLKTMQQTLKAKTLEDIAIAVALLTASMVALSFVNVGNLAKALGAMTVLFGELLTSLQVVSKVAGSSGVVKMAVIGAALNELAVAILILTGAVAILGHMSWSELTKGLSAIGILLTELSVAAKLMSGNTKGLIVAAPAMIGIAVALNIMAAAVKLLGSSSFSTLEKGVGTIAALLLVVAGFQKIGGGKNLISSAASMTLIAAAINIMASAVGKLGALPTGTIAKGLASIAATLLILAVGMKAMQGSLAGSASLALASAGLLILSKAIKNMGAETWGEIGHALVALAGSLVIIIAAMALMSGALPGAAALIIVAGALTLLSGVLVVLGHLSWDNIIKGLAALAGIFAVIGVAGLLLAPIVPALLGLGAAVLLVGVGIAAAGAGVLLFGLGLTALSVGIVAASAAFLAFIKVVAKAGPEAIAAFAGGIADMAKAVGQAGKAIIDAFTQIFGAVLDLIVKLAPKFAAAIDAIVKAMVDILTNDVPKVVTAFLKMLQSVLTAMATYFPKFAATAIQIVINMLNAIAKKIPDFAQSAVNLCVAFINAIGSTTVKIVAAAVKMVISVINGIAGTLNSDSPKLDAALRNLGSAIVTGIIGAIVSLAGGIANALVNAVKGAIQAAKNWLESLSPSKRAARELGMPMSQGMAVGVNQGKGLVSDAMVGVAKDAISKVKDTLSNLESIFGDSFDLQPQITPVVDLTKARQGLSDLAGLTKDQIINAGTSFSSAASISAANAAAAAQAGLFPPPSNTLQFTQNNYSPQALSTIDIYRQTKNQLSVVKGALAGNANAG